MSGLSISHYLLLKVACIILAYFIIKYPPGTLQTLVALGFCFLYYFFKSSSSSFFFFGGGGISCLACAVLNHDPPQQFLNCKYLENIKMRKIMEDVTST